MMVREKGVKDTLTSEERMVGAELLGNGAGRADGPNLEHGVLELGLTKLELENNVLGSNQWMSIDSAAEKKSGRTWRV